MSKINEDSWGKYDFLGVAKYITVASVILTVAALVVIATKGLNYGVDFRGGIGVRVQFAKHVEAGQVRQMMTSIGYPSANVQFLGEGEYLLRVEGLSGVSDEAANNYINETVTKIKNGLSSSFTAEGASVRQVDTVGPQVGHELKRNGILAGFYCLLLILIYIGLRFDYRFAPGAVFCLFHDAIITLGIYSLFDWDFSTQTMAAILTIIGYSLNDTIVIFDRIRENQHLFRDRDLYWLSNLSLNETLSRTILTYVTTYIMVFSMFFFADGVIREFAETMLIGMFLGAYSTIYVATPLMLLADRYQKWWRAHQLATA